MDFKLKRTFVLALFVSNPAFANTAFEDLRVVVGASIGYSAFDFPEKLDHEISYPSINVPIALTSKNWQLSANLQTSLSDADISEEEDLGKASRDDLDLTLGYRLSTNWTLFGGYKYGNTDIQFTPRDLDDDEDGMLTITDENYEQKGPFVGIGYSWRFEKAGSLSLTLAYAKLKATNVFSANTDEEEEDDDEDERIEFDDISGRVTGDTHGFSYSLSWTMPVSTNLLFQTRIKVNDYRQDIYFNDMRFDDIDEIFTSLHVGVAYVF